jgi:hypothetical protein
MGELAGATEEDRLLLEQKPANLISGCELVPHASHSHGHMPIGTIPGAATGSDPEDERICTLLLLQ